MRRVFCADLKPSSLSLSPRFPPPVIRDRASELTLTGPLFPGCVRTEPVSGMALCCPL